MPTLEQKAVYTSRESEIALATGTGCMILEERDASIEERITVGCLVKTKDGLLIDVETGKRVLTMLSQNNLVDLAEAKANKKTEASTGDPNKTDLWISPPHPLRSEETRLTACVTYTNDALLKILPYVEIILKDKQLALKRIVQNGNVVVMYAFPSKMSADECLVAAQKIVSCSTLENPQVETPEQLRQNPLVYQSNQGNWAEILFGLGLISKESLGKINSNAVFKMRQKANIVGERLKDEFKEEYLKAGEEVNARTKVVNRIRERAKDYGYYLYTSSSSCPTSGRITNIRRLTHAQLIFRKIDAEQEADKFRYIEIGLCVNCSEVKLISPAPYGCRWCRDCTVTENVKDLQLSA